MNIFKRQGFINVYISVTCWILSVFQEIPLVNATDNFALIVGSLRTFQVHACDGEILSIKCPPHTVININYAHYGRPSAAESCAGRTRSVSNGRRRRNHPDGNKCVSQVALRVIENKCHEQVSCRMIVSATTFLKDPCPNVVKYAEVAYKCRPAQFINVIACEGDKMNLSCEESMRILVIKASFGSSKDPVMECPQNPKTSEEECSSSYALERVVNMCVRKRSCSFDIDSQNLGDPKCSEFIRKHLKIAYTCVPVEVLKYSEYKSDGSGNANELMTQTTNEIEVHTTSYPAWASNIDRRIPPYLLPAPAPSLSTDHKIEMQSDHISTTDSNVSDVSNRELVSFISEWIAAEHYITGNKSKLIVYVSVSLTVGTMLFVVVILIHIFILRKLDNQKTKEGATLKEPPAIVEDDFFSDSDLDHFDDDDDDPLNIMNSLNRKISETIPRAPVSDDPSTNHYFS